MDDALLVRGGQAVGDLRGDVERLAVRQRAVAEQAAQVAAVDVLHHDVRRAGALIHPHFMNGDDVRVIERGCRAGLAREAGQRLLIAGEADGQKLDGDLAAEGGIAGDIDLAHPARAERREDLVLPEFLAHHRH